MANNDVLSEFSPADINHFKKDFMQMIKVGAEIDRYYGEAQHDLDTLIPKFEKLIEKFNKKYKGIKIVTPAEFMEMKVSGRIEINATTIKPMTYFDKQKFSATLVEYFVARFAPFTTINNAITKINKFWKYF